MEEQPISAGELRPAGATTALRLVGARDERLARMVADGSDRAFAALYRRHGQTLYRYCRSIVGNEADAQDALQSTFAAALVALRRGTRDAPLRPWLFRIAHNESITLIRRRRPTVELSLAEASPGPSAAAQALARDRLRVLVRDLQDLGDRQRGALVMRELSGLGHEEIAVALDLSVGAAKQAIFEARRALAEFEEGRAMPCDEIRHMISDGDRRILRGRRVRAHLRACAGCAAFAAAIGNRHEGLQAIAPPLAPAAFAGVLAHVAGFTGSGHGAAGAGALAASTAGKSATAALAAKTLVGAALVTGTAIGVTRAVDSTGRNHRVNAPARSIGSPPNSGARSGGASSSPANGAARTQSGGEKQSGAAAGAGPNHVHARAKALGRERGATVHGGRGHAVKPAHGKGTGSAHRHAGVKPKGTSRGRSKQQATPRGREQAPVHPREPLRTDETRTPPEQPPHRSPEPPGKLAPE